MAFAWVRTKNLLGNYFDQGEIIIGMTVTRFTRDRDEFRRLAPPRAAASIVMGTIDVVEAVVFAMAAIAVLITSTAESPPKPMRFWIAVYAIQCIVHLAWLYMQGYRRQQLQHFFRNNIVNMNMSNVEFAKELMFLCWWTLGCYWLLQSSKAGSGNSAPKITWLSGIFLFFDIFLFFCAVTLAFILGLVLCCFLPLAYAFFYILGDQVYDALPPCPFCGCCIHKSNVRFM